MEKAYKFRIYPNKTQENLIQKTFGCVRFVYNYFLDKRIKAYEADKTTLNYSKCSAELTKLKKEYEWLKEPDKCSLQNSLKNLDAAYQNFFRRKKPVIRSLSLRRTDIEAIEPITLITILLS